MTYRTLGLSTWAMCRVSTVTLGRGESLPMFHVKQRFGKILERTLFRYSKNMFPIPRRMYVAERRSHTIRVGYWAGVYSRRLHDRPVPYDKAWVAPRKVMRSALRSNDLDSYYTMRYVGIDLLGVRFPPHRR
jgi:hypothetical protein